ncbi:MAG: hypothetical protein RL748_901 [Pseudomonadota bacterium]
MRLYLLSTLTLSLLANLVNAHETTAPVAASGIDKQFIDTSVRPQDDFFRHLNGQWLKNTDIPADKARWGTFDKLRDDVQPRLLSLIEAAQKNVAAARKASSSINPNEQKIGDFYSSYMDEAKLEQLRHQPLLAEIERIKALKDKSAIPAQIAHFNALGIAAPYGISVGQDARDSTRYAAYVGQSGLGLPDRDYYLKKDDAKFADIRAKYERHIETTLTLAGEKDAAASAKAIVALESAMAEVQWDKVANRDPVKRYNKLTLEKLAELTPGYDWKAALTATGIVGKVDSLIVSQPSYLAGLNQLLEKTPLTTLQAYFEWQLLRAYSEYLSKDFVEANFAFYGKTITGTTEMRPRWKRGATQVDSALGEALGQQFVTQYFPPERKARMEQLVQNLLLAYKQSIDTLDWMSPATKKEAQDKLAKFTPKIGYPKVWRDYSALQIKADDLVGNVMRSSQFARQINLSKLGKPINREEWFITPQTVNAFYNPLMNEIVFPASILQPPFFDMSADDAVNYGAIGAVIGHEISHGFDDSGSQFDGNGNLRNWWSAEDRKNFTAKADMLVAQYGSYSPLPGYNVNGKLTLGENIADNSGLAVAYKAYKLSLKGKPAPVIDGLTGEQRFFLGFGQVWRTKVRDEQQIALLKTDTHSPGQFRANGTLVNQPGFYEAFGVKEGDKMYVAPEKRIIIW